MSAGINIAFCKKTVIITNISPFTFPKANIQDAIVYPKQNPLNSIIPNTIGIPIIVVQANHKKKVSVILLLISFCNSSK